MKFKFIVSKIRFKRKVNKNVVATSTELIIQNWLFVVDLEIDEGIRKDNIEDIDYD